MFFIDDVIKYADTNGNFKTKTDAFIRPHKGKDANAIVAVAGNGTCDGLVFAIPSYYDKPYLNIELVMRDLTKEITKNMGEKLMSDFMDWAKNNGYTTLGLEANHPKLKKFYEDKCGFKEGTLPDIFDSANMLKK